ncbi:hypothetical protein [Nocardia cyriacigeorgica]|nr:hypothetical protein [Nocardia cyriacigeorgica]
MALYSTQKPVRLCAPVVLAQPRLMPGIASSELESGRLQDGR